MIDKAATEATNPIIAHTTGIISVCLLFFAALPLLYCNSIKMLLADSEEKRSKEFKKGIIEAAVKCCAAHFGLYLYNTFERSDNWPKEKTVIGVFIGCVLLGRIWQINKAHSHLKSKGNAIFTLMVIAIESCCYNPMFAIADFYFKNLCEIEEAAALAK